MKKILIILAILLPTTVFSQRLALKNNLAYDAILTPNISLEMSLGRKWTLDTQIGANFFFYTKDPGSSNYKSTKWSHWLVQPELRYWTCDVFNGWFFGLHAHGGQMNVGGIDIPFILDHKKSEMENHRYEGYFYGGGISIGYQWVVSDRFNIEASIGGGYARIHYDKYKCTTCGEKLNDGKANYLGPTKATLSLIYFLK
ncbi:hypothetical protein HR11_04860 [Porphyromonas macacae]|uniref:Protein of uncharacterized function (DUF3575) n=1 Tax=Porphyromonas macacae TaxID=28115 RepID=A0A379DKW8_9PORP|nr:DUF3575 domain-containing protein [Porphyromonas macacae]KGN99570.1 hypothetical protein HR11_04860 [Porphyromonas macacae]SUB78683.1 Protein of uncharacterised function (DUF3575) [Porphyromonas macacae]